MTRSCYSDSISKAVVNVTSPQASREQAERCGFGGRGEEELGRWGVERIKYRGL
jgi:hypothetical protein